MRLGGQVGSECRHRRRDRAGTLDAAPDDDPVNVRRPGCDEAADGKQQQADDDDPLAPVAVGSHAEGDLQTGLGQAVGTQGDADEGQVVATRNVLGVLGEHRQDQEQPQHAQRENRGERQSRPLFEWRHLVAAGGTHLGS